MDNSERLKAAVRDVPDFPSPGVLFKDITPILADPVLLKLAITEITDTAGNAEVDKVVGVDARGFIFGAAVAERLNAGFIPVRKAGKLPWTTESRSYALEYGEATVEIHNDAISAGERILIVDDLLATGGTAGAAIELVRHFEGDIVAITFLVELTFLNGRAALPPEIPVHAVIDY